MAGTFIKTLTASSGLSGPWRCLHSDSQCCCWTSRCRRQKKREKKSMFLVNFFHLTAWQATLSETSQSRVQVQQRHVEATTEKFHQQVKNLISDPDLWGPTGGPTRQKVKEFLLVETWHGVSVNIRRKMCLRPVTQSLLYSKYIWHSDTCRLDTRPLPRLTIKFYLQNI